MVVKSDKQCREGRQSGVSVALYRIGKSWSLLPSLTHSTQTDLYYVSSCSGWHFYWLRFRLFQVRNDHFCVLFLHLNICCSSVDPFIPFVSWLSWTKCLVDILVSFMQGQRILLRGWRGIYLRSLQSHRTQHWSYPLRPSSWPNHR